MQGSDSNAANKQSKVRRHSSQAIPLDILSSQLNGRITTFLTIEPGTPLLKRVQEQTRVCLRVCQDALSRYSLEQLCLSYNGGKDCLVLLICYLAAIARHFEASRNGSVQNLSNDANGPEEATPRDPPVFPSSIRSVYIQPPHPFAEVDEFVRSSSAQYHLSLAASRLPMKEAFAEYLAQNPNVKAIFVGTRRTDPHGGALTHFDETDRGWPKFMRIHPVIDWRYQEIWAFIRHLQIPYCPLYDLGYTSLGGTTDTHPNPMLRKAQSDDPLQAGQQGYGPAYELVLDEDERLGREK